MPHIPNNQHAIVSGPGEAAQHLPDALCYGAFRYPKGVALPIGDFEAQYVQLLLTARCLVPPVLNLWDYSRRPRGFYPVAGQPCRSGVRTRWNVRPYPAALEIRKRMGKDIFSAFEEVISEKLALSKTSTENDGENEKEPVENKGKILVDATVAEQAVRYPADLSLLNEARGISERLIDDLYKQSGVTAPENPERIGGLPVKNT